MGLSYLMHTRNHSSNQPESGTRTELEGNALKSEHHTSQKGSDPGQW